MQLITFKVPMVLRQYDKLMNECVDSYINEVNDFIKELLNYKPYISTYQKLYNWLFKIVVPERDISWIRALEKELKERLYTNKKLSQNQNYSIVNNWYETYFRCDDKRFVYDMSDIIKYYKRYKTIKTESRIIEKSESTTIQLDQDEAQRLDLHI